MSSWIDLGKSGSGTLNGGCSLRRGVVRLKKTIQVFASLLLIITCLFVSVVSLGEDSSAAARYNVVTVGVEGDVQTIDAWTGEIVGSFSTGNSLARSTSIAGTYKPPVVDVHGRLWTYDEDGEVVNFPPSVADIVAESHVDCLSVGEDGMMQANKGCGLLIGDKTTSVWRVNMETGKGTPLGQSRAIGNFDDEQQADAGFSDTALLKKEFVFLQRNDYVVRALHTVSSLEMWHVTVSNFQAIDLGESRQELRRSDDDSTCSSGGPSVLAHPVGDGDTTTSGKPELKQKFPYMLHDRVSGKNIAAVHPQTGRILWSRDINSMVTSLFGVAKGKWVDLRIVAFDFGTDTVASELSLVQLEEKGPRSYLSSPASIKKNFNISRSSPQPYYQLIHTLPDLTDLRQLNGVENQNGRVTGWRTAQESRQLWLPGPNVEDSDEPMNHGLEEPWLAWGRLTLGQAMMLVLVFAVTMVLTALVAYHYGWQDAGTSSQNPLPGHNILSNGVKTKIEPPLQMHRVRSLPAITIKDNVCTSKNLPSSRNVRHTYSFRHARKGQQSSLLGSNYLKSKECSPVSSTISSLYRPSSLGTQQEDFNSPIPSTIVEGNGKKSHTTREEAMYLSVPTDEGKEEDMVLLSTRGRYALEFLERGRLGKGGFGAVYKSVNRLDGHDYAMKKIYLSSDVRNRKQLARVLREVKIIAFLDHPNIVRYYQAWLEYAPDNDEDANVDEDNYSLGYEKTISHVTSSSQRRLSNFISSDIISAVDDDSTMSFCSDDSGTSAMSASIPGFIFDRDATIDNSNISTNGMEDTPSASGQPIWRQVAEGHPCSSLSSPQIKQFYRKTSRQRRLKRPPPPLKMTSFCSFRCSTAVSRRC